MSAGTGRVVRGFLRVVALVVAVVVAVAAAEHRTVALGPEAALLVRRTLAGGRLAHGGYFSRSYF